MDDTISDYSGSMRRALQQIGNESLPDNFHSDNMSAWMKARVELIRSQIGWWASLPAIQSGLELMELCKEIGYGIHILMQGPRIESAWSEKFQWADKYVSSIYPGYKITITRHGKGFIMGEF